MWGALRKLPVTMFCAWDYNFELQEAIGGACIYSNQQLADNALNANIAVIQHSSDTSHWTDWSDKI